MAVVVHGVAVRIEAHIAGGHSIHGDDLAITALKVLTVAAAAQTGRVIAVIIEDGGHTGCEAGIIGQLHDHIFILALITIIMLELKFIHIIDDLNPLQAGSVNYSSGVASGDELSARIAGSLGSSVSADTTGTSLTAAREMNKGLIRKYLFASVLTLLRQQV